MPTVSTDAGILPRDGAASALTSAATRLRGSTSVTVVCHENPDADTLGGGLALARALDALGIDVEVVCSTGIPTTMRFLPEISTIQHAASGNRDTIVLVDCASIDRAGPSVASWIRASERSIINVDHHVSNGGYGAIVCIDHQAAATSEIVARLIGALGLEPDREMAVLLLAGILHDTDGLRVPETSASTLRLTADLVDAGADLGSIHRSLFSQRPISALLLWGRVATSLQAFADGRVVIGTLTTEMLDACGAEMLDAEDLPELIASVRGAQVAILLREISPNLTRASIRTTDPVNAAAIALEFAGGGHDHAAGCSIDGDLDSARERLLDASSRHLRQP
ncbi:MAG: bifunctional oligoribonuclease/PAP phosphatase NrnA [Candidatus Limnocylindria bacterium]